MERKEFNQKPQNKGGRREKKRRIGRSGQGLSDSANCFGEKWEFVKNFCVSGGSLWEGWEMVGQECAMGMHCSTKGKLPTQLLWRKVGHRARRGIQQLKRRWGAR